jgi:hypothetical protein
MQSLFLYSSLLLGYKQNIQHQQPRLQFSSTHQLVHFSNSVVPHRAPIYFIRVESYITIYRNNLLRILSDFF